MSLAESASLLDRSDRDHEAHRRCRSRAPTRFAGSRQSSSARSRIPTIPLPAGDPAGHPAAVVADAETTVPSLRSSAMPCCRRLGVANDVPQRLLGDPVDDELLLGAQRGQASPSRRSKRGAAWRPILDVIAISALTRPRSSSASGRSLRAILRMSPRLPWRSSATSPRRAAVCGSAVAASCSTCRATAVKDWPISS